jgi:hypothetical protein
MRIPAFDRSLRTCSAAVAGFGLDVYGMLNSEDEAIFKTDARACMLCITAIQVMMLGGWGVGG